MTSKIVHLARVGEVLITKRRNQKRIRISISGSTIKVTQPYLFPFAAGEIFLKQRIQWILEHIKPVELYIEGQQIGMRLLTFKRHPRAMIGSKVAAYSIDILLPIGRYPEDVETQVYVKKKLTYILRQDAEGYLPKRVADLASMFEFSYKSVQVKLLKRRWGSCNSKKELVFNLNLMSLDTLHIDYVILHELTHTLHMNHGEKFWSHLESVFPDAKKVAKIVRRYNP